MTDAPNPISWIVEVEGWPLHPTLAPTAEDAIRAWLGIYFGVVFTGEPEDWVVHDVFAQVRGQFPSLDIGCAPMRLVRCVNA